MAIEWIKSLHCKSKDDVVEHHNYHRRHRHSSSCKTSIHGLKDIVLQTTTTRSKPEDPFPPFPPPPPPSSKRRLSTKSQPQPPPITTRFTNAAKSLCPSLAELPQGHPSRNVVEIIFRSGWGEKSFPGQVEMVFKVHNLTRTVARFEEYREHVKSRARAGQDGDDHARCLADGNEVMRFYCLGATTSGGAYETSGGGWGLHSGKGASAVCTYSGSSAAHENAGGGGGRRAMLVCRAIAGRVCKGTGFESRVGYDSRSTETGELYVFDTRAVLPCFLIIYNKLHQ